MVNVPAKTSINQIEYIPPKGSIAFAPELIPLIISGEKQSTYRYGLKYDAIEIGDRVLIINSDTSKEEAIVVVTQKRKTRFRDLPLVFDKHERYEDREHMRRVLSGYYAYLGRPLNDEDVFLVFEFEVK